MLTLYMRPSCPFCQRVIQIAENLNVPLDLKDIDEDGTAFTELQEKSGANQVPYLLDSEKGVSMPESNDIIEYLRDNYAGAGTAAAPVKPRVHVGGATCQSCEG